MREGDLPRLCWAWPFPTGGDGRRLRAKPSRTRMRRPCPSIRLGSARWCGSSRQSDARRRSSAGTPLMSKSNRRIKAALGWKSWLIPQVSNDFCIVVPWQTGDLLTRYDRGLLHRPRRQGAAPAGACVSMLGQMRIRHGIRDPMFVVYVKVVVGVAGWLGQRSPFGLA